MTETNTTRDIRKTDSSKRPIPVSAQQRGPYRADQVGSLLRTKRLAEARAKREAGEITAQQLKTVEDEEIRALVRKQEEVGLKSVTDGEFRRSWWHYDFLSLLDGVAIESSEQGIQFNGVQTKSMAPVVRGKIAWPKTHPFVDHFRFLAKTTKNTAKMTIPSPSMLYYRGTKEMFKGAYQNDIDAYYKDLAQAYADCVQAFYDAGCRYLQFDDVSFAYLCDPKQRKMLADRGDSPDELRDRNIKMLNDAIADRPNDMTVTAHLCRGNFRSTFVASGGYEPIADALFNEIAFDGYFMEWDNDRSGGFEPLRFLPKSKRAVLGLVTSKTGAMEKPDDLKRRIDEAAKFTPLETLCLSPQCGFASTEEGNDIADAEQWKKLELVVKVAEDVWG
jgi:5-methyltetrahydropteroyltriglutamate--homocysteine methyltransferase